MDTCKPFLKAKGVCVENVYLLGWIAFGDVELASWGTVDMIELE